MKDRNGNEVKVGDIVRVTELCKELIEILPAEEKPHVENMLGNEYPIEEFPEPGKASVSIEWRYEDGSIGISGLYLISGEFELVSKAKC